MSYNETILKNDELVVYKLRSLYRKYGYSQYKMSKFEEYDLYVRNKDFLVSDNCITFTDTNGKLLALKPDVTLSIIKNSRDTDNCVQKVYYNENVYRISKGTQSFKEIMQVGLECLGAIDDYCICEVLLLAAQSLKNISEDFVLDLSHMGIVSAMIDRLGVSHKARVRLFQCIGEKNLHDIDSVCKDAESQNAVKQLKQLLSLSGSPATVLPALKNLLCDNESLELASQLERIVSVFEKNGFSDKIRIDFSVIHDMNYYNGIVFKGFVNGIASGVLSGGQYDKLMQKMGRRSGAIGFAVYLDLLERFYPAENEYDVDAILLYDETADPAKLQEAVAQLIDCKMSVMAQKSVPDKIRYRQLFRLNDLTAESK